MRGGKRPSHPYEIRVAACADYLVGDPLKAIAAKYNLPEATIVSRWIRERGCFKLRNRDRKRRLHPRVELLGAG